MAIGDVSASSGNFLDPISGAIKAAATATGVDFTYLFQQAKVESGLNANAKAGTSSATGLFQFTKDTWFKVVEQHGDAMGLSGEASSLRNGAASAADRQKILDMRNNPAISAQLAAHYAIDNAKALQAQGHQVTGPTDLYLAHFLGSGGASKFLAGMKENPNAPAASVLPSAANANKAIFYKNGAPASFADIYQRFAKRFDGDATPSKNSVQLASLALKEITTPERATTVDALVKRLKAPEALNVIKPKPSEPLAFGTITPQAANANVLQPTFRQKPSVTKAPQSPIAHLTPLTAQAAPEPAADVSTLKVDTLAKFLDSASKWSAEPGTLENQSTKGVVARDASDGIHS
jgi:hypothetical protein